MKFDIKILEMKSEVENRIRYYIKVILTRFVIIKKEPYFLYKQDVDETFDKSPIEYKYLNDMISLERDKKTGSSAGIFLLWLARYCMSNSRHKLLRPPL